MQLPEHRWLNDENKLARFEHERIANIADSMKNRPPTESKSETDTDRSLRSVEGLRSENLDKREDLDTRQSVPESTPEMEAETREERLEADAESIPLADDEELPSGSDRRSSAFRDIAGQK